MINFEDKVEDKVEAAWQKERLKHKPEVLVKAEDVIRAAFKVGYYAAMIEQEQLLTELSNDQPR